MPTKWPAVVGTVGELMEFAELDPPDCELLRQLFDRVRAKRLPEENTKEGFEIPLVFALDEFAALEGVVLFAAVDVKSTGVLDILLSGGAEVGCL